MDCVSFLHFALNFKTSIFREENVFFCLEGIGLHADLKIKLGNGSSHCGQFK